MQTNIYFVIIFIKNNNQINSSQSIRYKATSEPNPNSKKKKKNVRIRNTCQTTPNNQHMWHVMCDMWCLNFVSIQFQSLISINLTKDSLIWYRLNGKHLKTERKKKAKTIWILFKLFYYIYNRMNTYIHMYLHICIYSIYIVQFMYFSIQSLSVIMEFQLFSINFC